MLIDEEPMNTVTISPILPARKMRGFVKGIDTDVERDADRV